MGGGQSVCQRRSSRETEALVSAVSPSVTMLSTSVPMSTMDGEDAEASTPLNPLLDRKPPGCQGGLVPSCWLLYFKPIVAISVGTLLFVSGTTLALLSFTQVGNVPYLLGPLFLFVGLMFLVTGLVWVPVLKQSLEQQPLAEVNHGKGDRVEHEHH